MRYFDREGRYILEDRCIAVTPIASRSYEQAIRELSAEHQEIARHREFCGPSYIARLPFRDVHSLRAAYSARWKHLRNFLRLLDSIEFDDAFTIATPKRARELTMILQAESLDRLKAWIHARLPEPSLEALSFDSLRAIAQQCRIPNYSRCNKTELIMALQKMPQLSLPK